MFLWLNGDLSRDKIILIKVSFFKNSNFHICKNVYVSVKKKILFIFVTYGKIIFVLRLKGKQQKWHDKDISWRKTGQGEEWKYECMWKKESYLCDGKRDDPGKS